MKARLTLKPGQRGTKKLVKQYGNQLFCVRYRYDEQSRRRYKTVELIIDETDWEPRKKPAPVVIDPDRIVDIRVEAAEAQLKRELKAAGGKRHAKSGLWKIRYDKVVDLGIEERMVFAAAV